MYPRDNKLINQEIWQQATQSIDSHALCLAMLDEQRKARKWSNVFKTVALTVVSVFLMGIYSNQQNSMQSQLINMGACSKQLNVNATTPDIASLGNINI